jgi:hypothetical protein
MVGAGSLAMLAYACAQGAPTSSGPAQVLDASGSDVASGGEAASTNDAADTGSMPDGGVGVDSGTPPLDAGQCLRVGTNHACGLSPQCGCAIAETCDVSTSNAAETTCVGPAGNGVGGSLCANTGSCARGLTCLYSGTCHAFCAQADQACADGGMCLQLRDQADAAVPNALVCEIACQLQDTAGCGAGGACYPSMQHAGITDCYRAGMGTLGANCTYLNDCAAGLGCVGSGSGQCKHWCRAGNGADCGGQICSGFNPKLVLNGQEYGTCP